MNPKLPLFRIIHAMEFKPWLLATSALWHPEWVGRMAAWRSVIRRMKEQEAKFREGRFAK